MSSETETVFIKLHLSAAWWNDPPKYEILIDDTVFDYGEIREHDSNGEHKEIMFSAELPEGEHTLKVRLIGKLDHKHVVLDSDNNILKDQLLHIRNIEIDEIELDNLIWSHSYFHKQVDADKNGPIYSDVYLQSKHPSFGWNGEYRLPFSVPTYMWFLETL